MNELQLRVEVQGAVQNYAEQLLDANGIPAHLVEDAFHKTLSFIQERTLHEFIASVTVPTEDPDEGKEDNGGEEIS